MNYLARMMNCPLVGFHVITWHCAALHVLLVHMLKMAWDRAFYRVC